MLPENMLERGIYIRKLEVFLCDMAKIKIPIINGDDIAVIDLGAFEYRDPATEIFEKVRRHAG